MIKYLSGYEPKTENMAIVLFTSSLPFQMSTRHGALDYLAQAKKIIDEASEECNAAGVGILVGAMVALLETDYFGEGNNSSMSVHDLAKLAETLTGRKPSKDEIESATSRLED